MILGKDVKVRVSDFMEHMVQAREDGSFSVSPQPAGNSAPFLELLGYTKVVDSGTEQLWQRVDVS